jgi:hypothetical protein
MKKGAVEAPLPIQQRIDHPTHLRALRNRRSQGL